MGMEYKRLMSNPSLPIQYWRIRLEASKVNTYQTKGLGWLFLESYVRLSNYHEAISEDCFLNRFCYQVVVRLYPGVSTFLGQS
jgi:hypothetical protein